MLPGDAVSRSIDAISKAEMLIIGGTSLTVYPAASYINYFRGKYLVVINRDPLALTRTTAETLIITDSIGVVFKQLTS